MTDRSSCLAVIPARGGSQRIARKNIREFHGKPIIAYAVATAQASQLFDRIIVSTEDETVAEIAKESGAEVPFSRNPALADEHTGTVEVIADAIQQLRSQGHEFTHVCCIYPATPLLKAEYLEQAYQMLCDQEIDYAFSVGAVDSDMYRAIKQSESGGALPILPEYTKYRTQDLPPLYRDAGQFYWGTSNAWCQHQPLYSERSRMVVLPEHLVCDIDEEADWLRAEHLYKRLNNEG